MATTSSTHTSPKSKLNTTPGAFPSTPASAEAPSPTVVSSQLSLSQAVHKRKAEYTRSRRIRVKVGTWNVASLSGTEKDVGGWFVDGKGVSESLSGLDIKDDGESRSNGHNGSPDIESVALQEEKRSKKRSTIPRNDPGSIPGGDEIGLYVLGLQEIVDISSVAEALRPFSDPNPGRKWKQAVAKSLPNGYQQVAEQQLIGLFLIIYASSEVAPTISSVSTTSVGTGLGGYMGNKGAVTARIVLGETTRMVFVNCHLNAGVEKGNLERRNWDASQILQRTKFDPVDNGGGVMEEFGEGIGDEDFAFWFGDLNYRLESMPGEDVRRLLMLHTRNEYGVQQTSSKKIENELAKPESPSFARNQEAAKRPSEDDSPSNHTAVESSSDHRVISSNATLPSQETLDPASDPASLQTTLSSLLAHDQLNSQMQLRKAFHEGWREGIVDFLPTYKYDVGSVGMFDSSEKQRGPSWCDRILYRTRKDRLEYEQRVRDEEIARKKDNELKLQGVVDAVTDESVLFDYDPETDGADNENNETNEQFPDPELVTTKSGFEDRLQLDYYKSHQRVLSSDHKPLDAVFTLDYDAVDPEAKIKIHQEVARELDKAENDGRPVVTIVVDHQKENDGTDTDPSSPKFEGVDFGHVKYDHVKTRSVTIANTGRVPATVGFVDRSFESSQPGGVAPPWLKINFDRPPDNKNSNPGALPEHTLHPGDAVNVELTLQVNDLDLVRRLSDKVETLEDVLVIRIHNGRDYFLPVHGDWLQSAFGRSIEKLVRIPEGGVRRWQQQRPDGSSHGDEGVKWSAPREVFRLTEAIEDLVERALAQWGMTGDADKALWEKDVGWPFRGWISEDKQRAMLREIVREGLDSDRPFSETFPPEIDSLQRLEAVAETLVQFLQSLEDGIVTEALWLELEKGMIEREKAKKTLSEEDERMWILDALSTAPAHSVSFTFVTFMLARVATEVAPPKLPPPDSGQAEAGSVHAQIDAAYAGIFAEAMIRLPAASKGKERKAGEARRKHVVEVFLRSKVGGGN
ncbi:MAG: hypothetical protein ALECFALPRED_003495 [Alectoria fallacina]|uniref:Inositol polyphosphate-related phosphatase domain-containing protein n=1 Tax=Alectoria fallacina TaxID=1903189 RepID=A0A8H3FSR5_9LECA|nr:MAG: hypothetical protein ALECFALPRED_003495 [Alectoria fallacina]